MLTLEEAAELIETIGKVKRMEKALKEVYDWAEKHKFQDVFGDEFLTELRELLNIEQPEKLAKPEATPMRDCYDFEEVAEYIEEKFGIKDGSWHDAMIEYMDHPGNGSYADLYESEDGYFGGLASEKMQEYFSMLKTEFPSETNEWFFHFFW